MKSHSKWTPFNPDLADKVIEMVAAGDPINHAAKKLGIDSRTVRDWASNDTEFARRMQFARREGYEIWAGQILTIGDEVAGETENAVVQAARVRIDSRKWLLSKLHPEQYGDKVELTGAGGKDLLASPEAQIPRLMQVLAILMPGTANSELHQLATSMAQKLTQLEGPKGGGNGHDGEEP